MSNNGLPTGIKKTDVQSELKRINAMSDAALAREAAASEANDRDVNAVETATYTNVKNEIEKLPLKDIPNYIKHVSKEVGNGDGVGGAAVAIAGRFFPTNDKDMAIIANVKEMENKELTGSYELYGDATLGYEVDDLKRSDAYKAAQLNQSMKKGLAMVAATVLDLNASQNVNHTDVALGVGSDVVNDIPGISPDELDELPALTSGNPMLQKQEDVGIRHNQNPLNNTIPDPSGNFQANKEQQQPTFDVSKVRKENETKRMLTRLSNNVKVNGPEVKGYFPYSNLKFSMDPTNSVLDVEDDFSEIEKMYMSDGLSNMSKFITSASNHVTLLTGDTDASIINPKDTLRQKLHFMDFKYLLIAKALSTGENVLPVDVTCPSCMKSYNLDLNVKQCLALFPEELQKSHDEYDGGKTYKELTENWRVPETSNVITKLEKPILDEFTSKYFDKVMYTLNFIEPSIDKYMKIKEAAIALLTFVFKEDMTPDMMRNEVSLLTTLYNRHPVRVARLQSIMESFTILESITISYFDTRSGADVLVTTDEITIEEYLDVVKLYDLITVYLPTDVLGAAREYLMNRYKLDEIRQKLADRTQEPIEEIPMPTLLDEMTQISMENLTCPECGHIHAAEASVLFLGFSLVEKLMQKIRV